MTPRLLAKALGESRPLWAALVGIEPPRREAKRREGSLLKLQLSLLPVVVAALFVPGTIALASTEEPRFNPPKQYYLALGDSFTYGFQFSKLGLPPMEFNTGYVDAFATRLRAIRPDLVVLNYGCPGESSFTFIAGGCPGRAAGVALHDNYAGAQLAAAVAFLRAHPGRVSPITLTVWSNDYLDLVQSCGGDFVCVQAQAPTAIAQYASRLARILHALRTAAPSAEIIVSGSWHSFLEFIPLFDAQFAVLNAVIADAAAAVEARFGDLASVLNPPGAAPRLTAICTLTLLCSDGDGHPSDAGYRAIADVLFETSGYARLIDE
jgi:lysophospholipase L1-like esterase